MAAAPEFIQLLDCAVMEYDVIDGAVFQKELWLIGGGKVELLLTNGASWSEHATLRASDITSISLVGSQMWLGDEKGYLHVYNAEVISLLYYLLALCFSIFALCPSCVVCQTNIPTYWVIQATSSCYIQNQILHKTRL